MKILSAKNYLKSINNKQCLKKTVILSPHQWLIKDLIGNKKSIMWQSNGALIYREKKYDLVVCLPGASMAMITMEEMIAIGVKKIIYIGTGAGLRNQPSGALLHNPKVISVLNPFSEQKDINWSKVVKEKIEIVDMEAEYLNSLAKAKKVNLAVWLIVADHISKDEWQPLVLDDDYKIKYKKAITEIMGKLKFL